jgi:hypothetical protein
MSSDGPRSSYEMLSQARIRLGALRVSTVWNTQDLRDAIERCWTELNATIEGRALDASEAALLCARVEDLIAAVHLLGDKS